jgi:glycosyltransferase involved in cell wall biosynthesis
MQSHGHEFVVLAYGDSPYLPACLASVCAQQGGSRVIVTTSTPSSHISDIAQSYGLEVHVAEGQRGIAADFNFGLSCAKADIVTLAHQDDVYYPDFVQETCRLFRSTPNASLCFTDYDEIDDGGRHLASGRMMRTKRMLRSLAVGRREVVENRSQKRRLLAFGSVIPCPSVSLNRMAVPDFRFSDDYQVNLDWDAWWRLQALDHPFVLSQRILMGHRLHRDAETSRSKRDGRRQEEDRRMFRRIWPAPVASALAVFYRLGY